MKNVFYGVHFYLNINNLNKIVKKDENKHEDLARSFHALEIFLKSIEKFVLDIGNIEIEKFTTSRLHLYTKDCGENSIIKMMQVICFSNSLTDYMHKSIGKYKNLDQFTIGVGADSGYFTEFVFSDPESQLMEMTTIGSPANRAAKLQANCANAEMLFSKEVYDFLPQNIKSVFWGDGLLSAKLAKKYAELTVYKANYDSVEELLPERYFNRKKSVFEFATQQANGTNVGDIDFSDANSLLDFTNLSLKKSKHLTEAAVLYADIRGFTNKVDEESLSDIKQLTQMVLKGMNKAVRQHDGVHVQFQGDRESAIFNAYNSEEDYFALRALFGAMRMLDMVDIINQDRNEDRLDIGIGVSLGDTFATRVGVRNNKDNVIMGETVKEADTAEDEVAGVNLENHKTELVVTSEFYNYLVNNQQKYSKIIRQIFSLRKVANQIYYVCTIGYKDFQSKLIERARDNNANNAKSNTDLRPWSKE